MSSKNLVERILGTFGAKDVQGVGLVGVVPIPPEMKRTQKVLVIWDDSGEGFWIGSVFASSDELSPSTALKLSEQIPYGISTMDGEYHVKHYMYFDDVTEERLKHHYLKVAIHADQLEEYTGADKN